MKRIHLLAIAALSAASSAYADDVDFYPNGFASSVIREAKSERQQVAVAAKAGAAAERKAEPTPSEKRASTQGSTEVASRQSRQQESASN